MTPADEAQFITLWQQGAPQAAIAQALGIPLGTVKTRATNGGPGGPVSLGR
jgi:DNA-directed RNA polymerase specialized sigma24 family protein